MEIKLYKLQNGKSPFRDWYTSIIDEMTQSKIDIQITRLRYGNPGKAKSVGAGVMELKIDFGPGLRVYYGQDGNDLVILLLGGNKSSQAPDIQRAQEFWAEYKERKQNE